MPKPNARRHGFTLIELLVVISIIALLIGILLPVLGAARSEARAIRCAAHQRSLASAFTAYTIDNRDTLPPSYAYLDSSGGYGFKPGSYNTGHPGGYLHWSGLIFELTEGDAFTCPSLENGGHPRTNPGPKESDWEEGQVDQNGSGPPSTLEDRQVPRLAFTANNILVPKFRFPGAAAPSPVIAAQFVRAGIVSDHSVTILAAEFAPAFPMVADGSGPGNYESKTHRSVSPAFHVSTGWSPYGFGPGLTNPRTQGAIDNEDRYLDNLTGISPGTTAGTPGSLSANAIGRHHPGSYSADGESWGGTSNFLYLDGHSERKNIYETFEGSAEWGDKYYSLISINPQSSTTAQVQRIIWDN